MSTPSEVYTTMMQRIETATSGFEMGQIDKGLDISTLTPEENRALSTAFGNKLRKINVDSFRK